MMIQILHYTFDTKALVIILSLKYLFFFFFFKNLISLSPHPFFFHQNSYGSENIADPDQTAIKRSVRTGSAFLIIMKHSRLSDLPNSKDKFFTEITVSPKFSLLSALE